MTPPWNQTTEEQHATQQQKTKQPIYNICIINYLFRVGPGNFVCFDFSSDQLINSQKKLGDKRKEKTQLLSCGGEREQRGREQNS